MTKAAPLLVRHDLADPSSPAGMVRISDGRSYRFIWSVHLSGWESMGWQVVAGVPAVVEPLGTEQVVAPKTATTKTTKTRASKEPSVPVAPVDSEPLSSELAADLLI